MTDKNISEIYALSAAALGSGQPYFRIHIFPFKLTEESLKNHKTHSAYLFWVNLKEGYDHFLKYRRPPNVNVVSGRYVFDQQ